jgi:AcrR family transcriptional regulator
MAESKDDPRVQRTKEHVLATAVAILQDGREPLNFTTLAARARVSRRTLYTHWGSVEALIVDTLGRYAFDVFDVSDDLTFEQRVRLVVDRFSEYLVDRSAATSIAMIMSAAKHDPESQQYLQTTRAWLWGALCDYLGPMDLHTYSLIFGSSLYMALSWGDIPETHRTATVALILERVQPRS